MNNRRSFIVGLKSTEISSQEQLFLKKYKPWGIILFTRNIKNLNQTKKLTSKIRNIFNDKKYPIMIDQEGGRVSRLENIISFKNLTSDFFGKKYVKNKKDFDIYFKIFIDKTSYLLKELGININSVPVLDLKISGSSKIIGDRSFSRDPNIVSKMGDICIQSYKENSIGTIIKHIPGHGLAKVDSHFSTPYISKSLQYLLKNDFKAFKIVSKYETIRPSLEPSHAFSVAISEAKKLSKDTIVVVNSCGDAYKDKKILEKKLGVRL